MTRTEFVDALLSRQIARGSRAHRLVRAAERAERLALARSRERALCEFSLTDPRNGVEAFLARHNTLASSAIHHQGRAARLFRAAADSLTRIPA